MSRWRQVPGWQQVLLVATMALAVLAIVTGNTGVLLVWLVLFGAAAIGRVMGRRAAARRRR